MCFAVVILKCNVPCPHPSHCQKCDVFEYCIELPMLLIIESSWRWHLSTIQEFRVLKLALGCTEHQKSGNKLHE